MSGQKYTSLSAFQQGVADVNESLTDGERLVLSALAVNADYKSATSRPGNAALMRRSNRKERALQEILKGLRVKGLLELASKGDGGRGLATVHRFCIEDSRYSIPTEKSKPRSTECGDTSEKPRIRGHGDIEDKPRSSDEKPRSGETETPQLEPENPAAWDAPLPKCLPEKPSQPPSTNGGAAVTSSEKPADKEKDFEAVFNEFEDSADSVLGSPIVLSAEVRKRITEKVGDVSDDSLGQALMKVLRRPEGWDGMKNPAAIVERDVAANLRSVKRAIARDANQQACIAHGQAEHAEQEKVWAAERAEQDAISERIANGDIFSSVETADAR
jgi:hypothetical protein